MDIILPSDFQALAINIVALIFPTTEFQLLSQKIDSGNLAMTFKSQRDFSENFRVRFFPKIKTLILSKYYKKGTAHLIYIPADNYNWVNGRGQTITSADCDGERFEFLANKFYPFLEEFFIPHPALETSIFDHFDIQVLLRQLLERGLSIQEITELLKLDPETIKKIAQQQ